MCDVGQLRAGSRCVCVRVRAVSAFRRASRAAELRLARRGGAAVARGMDASARR